MITTKGWWDASDLSSITSVAGKVSNWADQTGNAAYDMVQPNGSLQMDTGVHTLGGLNTVSNDDSGTGKPHMYWNNPNMSANHMFFCAMNMYNGAFSQGPFSFINSGNYWGYLYYRNNASTRLACGGNAGADIAITPYPTVNNPQLFSGVFDGTGTVTKTVYINGTSEGSNGYLNVASNTQFRLGKNFDQSPVVWLGEAFFVPNDVSNDIRYKCEGYLAWKWNLVSKLPSNHPYKTHPPYNHEPWWFSSSSSSSS